MSNEDIQGSNPPPTIKLSTKKKKSSLNSNVIQTRYILYKTQLTTLLLFNYYLAWGAISDSYSKWVILEGILEVVLFPSVSILRVLPRAISRAKHSFNSANT